MAYGVSPIPPPDRRSRADGKEGRRHGQLRIPAPRDRLLSCGSDHRCRRPGRGDSTREGRPCVWKEGSWPAVEREYPGGLFTIEPMAGPVSILRAAGTRVPHRHRSWPPPPPMGVTAGPFSVPAPRMCAESAHLPATCCKRAQPNRAGRPAWALAGSPLRATDGPLSPIGVEGRLQDLRFFLPRSRRPPAGRRTNRRRPPAIPSNGCSSSWSTRGRSRPAARPVRGPGTTKSGSDGSAQLSRPARSTRRPRVARRSRGGQERAGAIRGRRPRVAAVAVTT